MLTVVTFTFSAAAASADLEASATKGKTELMWMTVATSWMLKSEIIG